MTRNKVLLYPDERPGFVLPERYRLAEKKRSNSDTSNRGNNDNATSGGDNGNDDTSNNVTHPRAERTESGSPNAFHDRHLAPGGDESFGRAPSEDSQATLVVEEAILARQGAQGIPPEKMREMMQDPNIVTWYGVDDEENPINW